MTELIDVQSIICQRLIQMDVAGGNVYVSDQPIEYDPPAVFVSETSLIGNTWEGFWESIVTVNCVDVTERGALILARLVRRVLDGWGDNDIDGVSHTNTIPMRTTESNPILHTRVVTFRVVYQELLTPPQRGFSLNSL